MTIRKKRRKDAAIRSGPFEIRSFFDLGLQPIAYGYVALNDVPNRWNRLSWAAPFWRVHWTDTAGAALRIGRKIISILPDHLYIIPPNIDFGSSHHGNCRQLYIHFQIRHPYTLCGPPIVTLPLIKQRLYFVRRIITCHGREKTARHQIALLVRALIETLIADLMKKHYLTFHDIDKRLSSILIFMEQHLAQPITNQKTAMLLHVHPETMWRLFKKELGMSPQAYLRQMRMDKACWFLRFSDESIKAIAEKTGFCDRYHFTKVFTALIGQSPARFRDYNKSATGK